MNFEFANFGVYTALLLKSQNKSSSSIFQIFTKKTLEAQSEVLDSF
jgi:hypothetical protein